MKALDLFCGIGGTTAAMKRFAFSVTGVDADPEACKWYNANWGQQGSTGAHHANILSLTESDVQGFGHIHASPPCQAHSQARRKQGETAEAKRLDLAVALSRHTGRLMQKSDCSTFSVENVAGYFRSAAYASLIDQLDANEWTVSKVELRAHYLGVPQKRNRTFAIGYRKPYVPNPVSVGRTISHHQGWSSVLPMDMDDAKHYVRRPLTDWQIRRLEGLVNGSNNLKHGEFYLVPRAGFRGGDYPALAPSEAVKTITATRWDKLDLIRCDKTSSVNQWESATLTPYSLARLQDFDPGIKLPINNNAAARLVGNAVPQAMGISVMLRLGYKFRFACDRP